MKPKPKRPGNEAGRGLGATGRDLTAQVGEVGAPTVTKDDQGDLDHRVALHVASNPFDHPDLLEEGVRAYEQTSDARVDGRLLDVRKILRDGFRRGRLDLLLIREHGPQDRLQGVGHLRHRGKGVEFTKRLDLLLIAQNQHGRLAEEKGEALGGMDEDAVGTEEQCRRVEAGTGMSGGSSAAFAGHELLLSPPTIPQIVGFDVVSVHRNWLQGHQVYLKPTHRGKGLLAAYFDAALALASSRGLDGMFFWSTLDRWLQKPPKGFKMKGQLKQSNGVMVRSFWREV